MDLGLTPDLREFRAAARTWLSLGGFTAEHTAHLFLKRAHSLATLLLTPAELRGAIFAAPTTRPVGDCDAAA